jgi:hypothetical protein
MEKRSNSKLMIEMMANQVEEKKERFKAMHLLWVERKRKRRNFLLRRACAEFKCPITFKLMTDPVMAHDGRRVSANLLPLMMLI